MPSVALLVISTFLCSLPPTSGAPISPQVLGHRGGRKWAPENTLASFKRCVENGYGIELDIHRCKTGELIVIHDEDLSRTTNGRGLVKDKTLTQLKELSAGKYFGTEFEGEKLPLLSEVLDLVDGKVPIFIEIKNTPIEYPGIDDALIELLAKYKAKDSLTIISFDHAVLKRFHEKAPQYKIGFLDCAVPYDISDYAKHFGATAWHADFSGIRASDVELAHKGGVKVSLWTVNKPKDWASSVKMGVDSIVTDDPAGLALYLNQLQ